MPGHVESQSFNRSRVTLGHAIGSQEQHANDGVQVFRRAPQTIIKMRQQFLDRKIIEKMVLEDLGPKNDPTAGAASGPSLTNDQTNRGSVCHAM